MPQARRINPYLDLNKNIQTRNAIKTDKYAIASNAKNTPMKGILLNVSGKTVEDPQWLYLQNQSQLGQKDLFQKWLRQDQ